MTAKRIELVASATQTASGNSAAFSVPTISMAAVLVDVTAEDISDFDCWLEGSDDGGTTWSPIPCDSRMVASTRTVAILAAGAGAGDIVVSHAVGAEKFSAEFKHLPWDTVRLAWALTGTDITFSASMVGK